MKNTYKKPMIISNYSRNGLYPIIAMAAGYAAGRAIHSAMEVRFVNKLQGIKKVGVR